MAGVLDGDGPLVKIELEGGNLVSFQREERFDAAVQPPREGEGDERGRDVLTGLERAEGLAGGAGEHGEV